MMIEGYLCFLPQRLVLEVSELLKSLVSLLFVLFSIGLSHIHGGKDEVEFT